MSDPYTYDVSSEHLDAIRYNECEARPGLTTSRFRRLWNELAAANEARQKAEIARDEAMQACATSSDELVQVVMRRDELKRALDASVVLLDIVQQERDTLRAEVERLQEDAARYREARNDPEGFVHLLKLLVRDGDPKKLDVMMDRIIESRERRAAAIDAAQKPEPRMQYSQKDDPTNWSANLGTGGFDETSDR